MADRAPIWTVVLVVFWGVTVAVIVADEDRRRRAADKVRANKWSVVGAAATIAAALWLTKDKVFRRAVLAGFCAAAIAFLAELGMAMAPFFLVVATSMTFHRVIS